jgi:hypothetical protein
MIPSFIGRIARNKFCGMHVRRTVACTLLASVVVPIAAQTTRQEHVHQMSHSVMPFDISKVLHIFKMTEQGGVLRVVTREAGSSDQVPSFSSTYNMKPSSFRTRATQGQQQVIQNYEIGLTRHLEENGFKWKAVFAQERMWSLFLSRRSFVKKIGDWHYHRGLPGRNTSTLLPDLLLQCGMPFLKAALLREAPSQASPTMVFELLEASNLPVEILEELRLKKNSACGVS